MYETKYLDGEWLVTNPDGELVGIYDSETLANESRDYLNNKVIIS
jgi:hypothetical protein